MALIGKQPEGINVARSWRLWSIILLGAATFGCERSSPPPTAAKATPKATADVRTPPAAEETGAKGTDAPQDKGDDATSKAEMKTPPVAKEGETSPATPSTTGPASEAEPDKKTEAA